MFCFFLMRRRPPRSTRTDTLSPYTTLFRSAFTIFAGDARGDERSYARDLASTLDIPLTEAGYDLAAVDILRSSFIHAPRPGGRAQLQAYDKLRSEEHTSELPSLMRISYAVFCLKKKKNIE